MARWLTSREIALELGVSQAQVMSFAKRGYLKYVMFSNKAYRFLDPAAELSDIIHGRHLEHFAFISTRELAQILGLAPSTVRRYIMNRDVIPTRHEHKTVLFNFRDVRKIVRQFERRAGKKTSPMYSETIVRWVRLWLQKEETPVQILDELLKQAVKLPEPAKTVTVGKLWALFDQVNELLQECQK